MLVADLGGTSLRVAVVGAGGVEARARVATDALDGDAGTWLRRWLREQGHDVAAAAIAVAAPVDGERARLTNAAVDIDARDVGVPCVLLNDLAAAALGVDRVDEDRVVDLGGGPRRPDGPMAVLGVGTGLGEAVRVGEVVVPGEGGHGAFAPLDEEQAALWEWLRARHGYVDWEHVASGSALPALLEHAVERVGAGRELALRLERGDDPAPLVLELAEQDAACGLALRLLLTALGAEAGNLALRHLPEGGLWLVGGVAGKLRSWLLPGGHFDAAFRERGRFSARAAAIPRRLVLDDDVGLWGAAVAARSLVD
ncbi:MAG: glucokinase [Alphaproteobacteria bacterium]|nr:glucokinase [Alphaproteobacteria bacterium]